MAAIAGWNAFKDPESQTRSMTLEQRQTYYNTAFSYYRNLQFSTRTGVNWATYLADREMYKHTRLILNPAPNVVDFHVDNIWRPVPNDEFESLSTPLSAQTDEKIVKAVAQIDQWSNFLSEGQKVKRYAAATGNVLVEGMDDLDRQKVYHKTIWPGFVTDLALNAAGDVTAYTLEYDVYDRAARTTYRYKKIVTKESIRYFKNDKPFVPEGHTAPEEANPYGFVFAIWIKHIDDGGDHGLPAFSHFDKLDEVNSLASHLHDNIHKTIESPKLISGASEIVPIVGGTYDAATGIITPHDPRLNWVVMKTTSGAHVDDLAGSLALADAHPYLKELLASFSDDYPELQAQAVIKDHAQLSGAALERMLTPAQNRLNGSQPGYNIQLVKLRQMQIAVAGMRVNGGGWSRDDRQKDAFRPYGLQSYGKGDLEFSLVSTRLIQDSESETEDLMLKKAQRAAQLKGIGVDQIEQWKAAGFTDEQIKEMQIRLEAEKDELGDMERRIGIANSGEGVLGLKQQLKLINPKATPAEINAMAQEMARDEPVRNAQRMLNA